MDDTERYSWQNPPWSGQPVRIWVRALAWFWVALFLVVVPIAAFHTWQDGGVPREYWLKGLILLLGEFYFTILLFHIAAKGLAPKTWMPWK